MEYLAMKFLHLSANRLTNVSAITGQATTAPTFTQPQTNQIKRAAAPKHIGAAIAKSLRGLVSRDAAALDKLKDAAKQELRAFIKNRTDDNKNAFTLAFEQLKDASPEAEMVSITGQATDNLAYIKFERKIAKLQQAYNIIHPTGRAATGPRQPSIFNVPADPPGPPPANTSPGQIAKFESEDTLFDDLEAVL
jgi:hypothetical protein